MNWTNSKLRKEPTGEKRRLIQVGESCFLVIDPSGKKYFIHRFQVDGKRRQKTLGNLESLNVSTAIMMAQNGGYEPTSNRRFKDLAEEFFNCCVIGNSTSTECRYRRMLDKDLFPVIGDKVLEQITYDDWLAIFNGINERGATYQREWCRQRSSRIIKWCQDRYPDVIDYPGRMAKRFKKHRKQHFDAVIDTQPLSQLLAAIETHRNVVVRYAIKMQAWSMLRPGVTRILQWKWVDFENDQLVIPANIMKQNEDVESDEARRIQAQDHIVPLSRQAREWLVLLERLTGYTPYVFSSALGRQAEKPISENTMNQAIKSKKLPFKHVAHGFRATSRTLIAELFNLDSALLELQLGHVVMDRNGKAYNRTRFFTERRKMLQDWADFQEWLLECTRCHVDIDPDPVQCGQQFRRARMQLVDLSQSGTAEMSRSPSMTC